LISKKEVASEYGVIVGSASDKRLFEVFPKKPRRKEE
jgi:hypothetical protein